MLSPSTASESASSGLHRLNPVPPAQTAHRLKPVPPTAASRGTGFSLCSPVSLAHWYDQMEQAETGEGWGSWCERHGIYVAVSKEFIAALSAKLPRPAVEIAAGNGWLAASLGVVGTDPERGSENVLRMNARQTLRTLAPENVLTCFAPIDAGIEHAILGAPSVRQYVYIGPTPPTAPNWTAETLDDVERVLLTRLDYLTDFTRATHRRRAYAVLLKRDRYVVAP